MTQPDICIADEVEHIRACAVEGRSHVVSLGQLIFFSSVSGDAWVLDPEDQLAACLMTERQPLPVAISETVTTFQIAWQARYSVHDQCFITIDSSDRVTTYYSYPVQNIVNQRSA
jgi:hypothetical protein